MYHYASMPAHQLCHSKRREAESDKKMICEVGGEGESGEECNQQGIASAVGIVAVSATFSLAIQSSPLIGATDKSSLWLYGQFLTGPNLEIIKLLVTRI